jgi:hypothetical protein
MNHSIADLGIPYLKTGPSSPFKKNKNTIALDDAAIVSIYHRIV